MLERHAWKRARAVLRGGGCGNVSSLPDQWRAENGILKGSAANAAPLISTLRRILISLSLFESEGVSLMFFLQVLVD